MVTPLQNDVDTGVVDPPAHDLGALLVVYRSTESTLSIAPVVNDPSAMAVLSAWPLYPAPAWVPPVYEAGDLAGQPVPLPSDLRERWTWLWAPAWRALDLGDFAAAAGLVPEEARRVLRVTINQRLMYPDGTISQPAAKLLGAYTNSRLRAYGGKQPRPEPGAKGGA